MKKKIEEHRICNTKWTIVRYYFGVGILYSVSGRDVSYVNIDGCPVYTIRDFLKRDRCFDSRLEVENFIAHEEFESIKEALLNAKDGKPEL